MTNLGLQDSDKDDVLSPDELVSSGLVLQTYLNHTRLPDRADARYDEEYGGDGDGDVRAGLALLLVFGFCFFLVCSF